MLDRQNTGALSGSREPSPTVLALSGFDPARGQRLLERVNWALAERDLAKQYLALNPANMTAATTASLREQKGAEWLAEIFERMDGLACLERLVAIAMEAGTAETERLGPKDDSAAIAQPSSEGSSHVR